MKLARRLRFLSLLAAAFAIAGALGSLALEPLAPAVTTLRPLTSDHGPQFGPVSDGRYVVAQEGFEDADCVPTAAPGTPPVCIQEPARRVVVDLATGVRRAIDDDLWRLPFFDPLATANGTVATRQRLFDLANGTTIDAPWNLSFHPETRSGFVVYGATPWGIGWHDLETDANATLDWRPDGPKPGGVHVAAATRERILVVWQPDVEGDGVAATLLDVATGRATPIPLAEDERFVALRPHPWGVAAAMNDTRAMIAVARTNATPVARFFDARTGDALGETDLPGIPFESATRAGDRWTLALTLGHVSGGFDGSNVTHFAGSRGAVAVGADGSVAFVHTDDRVWLTGGSALAASGGPLDVRRLTLATAAVAAAGVSAGLAWAARRADRVAVASGSRCSQCGAPRGADLDFCAACGAH